MVTRNSNNLNPREQIFCDHYLINPNGKEAAIKAGHSEKTAVVTASKMLVEPRVATYLGKKIGERTKKFEITADMVIKEICRIAFVDPRKLFNEDGSHKAIHEIDDDTAAALGSVEMVETKPDAKKGATTRTYKSTLNSKAKGLEMLAKYFKLYTDAPVVNINLEAKKVTFK